MNEAIKRLRELRAKATQGRWVAAECGAHIAIGHALDELMKVMA